MFAVEVHPGLIIMLLTLALSTLVAAIGWIFKQLYEMRGAAQTVSKELTPNAGSSVKDTIGRLEHQQQEVKRQLVAMGKAQEAAFEKMARPFAARLESLEIAYVAITAQLEGLKAQAATDAQDVREQIEATQPKES